MNIRGKCFKCKSENITYADDEFEGENIYFPYKCDDCGHLGREYYFLEYLFTK